MSIGLEIGLLGVKAVVNLYLDGLRVLGRGRDIEENIGVAKRWRLYLIKLSPICKSIIIQSCHSGQNVEQQRHGHKDGVTREKLLCGDQGLIAQFDW